MKMNWKILAVITMAAILSLAAMGVTYAANGAASLCVFSWSYANDDAVINRTSAFSAGIDPGDSGLDPQAAQTPGATCSRSGYDSASSSVTWTADAINLVLNNAYPGYMPTIFFGLSNQWPTPGYVQSISVNNPDPDLLSVSLNGISLNQIIAAGGEESGALSIRVNDIPASAQVNGYALGVTIIVSQWSQPGQTLAIDNTLIAEAQTGSLYRQILSASNGNAPYAWTIVSGSLPPGLILEADSGLITGIPRAAGNYNFVVSLTDAAGDSVTASLALFVAANPYSGYIPSGSVAETEVTQTIPPGSTAELPPAGSTAEILPENPAGLETTPQPSIPTVPSAQTVEIYPVEVPGAVAEITLPPQALELSGVTPAASVKWWLIGSTLVVTMLLIFWFFFLIRRRKKQQKAAGE